MTTDLSPHPNRYSPISVTSLRNGFNSEFMRPSPIRNMNSSPSNAIVAHRQSPSYPSQRLINSRRSPILLVSSLLYLQLINKILVAKLSHLSIHNSESEQHQSSSSRTSTRQFRRLVRGWTTIVRPLEFSRSPSTVFSELMIISVANMRVKCAFQI